MLLVGNHTGGNMSPEVLVLPLAFSTYFGVERPFYQLAHNLVLASPVGPLRSGEPARSRGVHAWLMTSKVAPRRMRRPPPAWATHTMAENWQSMAPRLEAFLLALQFVVRRIPVGSGESERDRFRRMWRTALGVVLSLGMSPGRLLRLVLWEAALLGVIGVAIGTVILPPLEAVTE